MENYRTGLGFDLHRIAEHKKYLILGGYRIDCGFGLEAVSDGDVALHASADAICGAACLGDIGDYFPPQAAKSKDLDSRCIVQFILAKAAKRYSLVNLDITLVAERPRLFSHKEGIVQSLKSIFAIADINLKIKSKENTQILGGVNAISCLALALLFKK